MHGGTRFSSVQLLMTPARREFSTTMASAERKSQGGQILAFVPLISSETVNDEELERRVNEILSCYT